MRLTCMFFLALALILPGLTGCAMFHHHEDFREVIQGAQKQVFPTLVFVKPIKQSLGSGAQERQQVFGSGVIISEDGLIVTNSHVAIHSKDIKCVLYSSEQVSAQFIGADTDTDLALIKLQLPPGHKPLPTATLGDSDKVSEGQFVMAFGSPLGFSRSISFGVVSCAQRYLEVGPFNLWIQTDAAINPGNSGGPLVNDSGEVIGINTAKIAGGDNIGFAVPSNVVKRVVAELREKGRVERSYCGVQLQALKDFMRDNVLEYEQGVLVGGVDQPSPAAKAGLKAGDLILSLKGEEVRAMFLEDLPSVRTRFASLKIGEDVPITVQRGTETLQLTICPGEKQQQNTEGVELESWNCTVQEINKFRTPLLAYFAEKGVYVLGARNPGNAFQSGLRGGDIIVSVDKQPINGMGDLQEAYKRLNMIERGKRSALLEVLKAGYTQYIVLDFNRDMKKAEETRE